MPKMRTPEEKALARAARDEMARELMEALEKRQQREIRRRTEEAEQLFREHADDYIHDWLAKASSAEKLWLAKTIQAMTDLRPRSRSSTAA